MTMIMIIIMIRSDLNEFIDGGRKKKKKLKPGVNIEYPFQKLIKWRVK